MYMSVPYQPLFDVPQDLLQRLDQRLTELEGQKVYSFSLDDWERLDSYSFGLSKMPKVQDYLGTEVADLVMSHFPGERLFGWSLSMLPPKTTVVEHTDRMFFHRLARRIIVPVSGTKDVLNWSYAKDRKTKRYYLMPSGKAYRLNTAVTHSLANNGTVPRRAVYFDVMPSRLYERFASHPDLAKVILQQNTGVIHVL